MQPAILPRPDTEALGVRYRRSPLLAIGRDVYADTRLMLQRLEELFPASEASPGLAANGQSAGIAALLQKFTVDMSVFQYAARLIPRNTPLTKDAKFQKDRAAFMGPLTANLDPKLFRPEALVHLRQSFDVVETLLADGRDWIAGTDGPSLADLEGIWPFDWYITDLQPSPAHVSEQLYPRVYAWRARFKEALAAAKAKHGRAVRLTGEQAAHFVTTAALTDNELHVDAQDPLQLAADTTVEVFPTDGGGFTHKDVGRLIKLTKDQVAIAVQSPAGGQEVHLHAPRWEFRVRPAEASTKL